MVVVFGDFLVADLLIGDAGPTGPLRRSARFKVAVSALVGVGWSPPSPGAPRADMDPRLDPTALLSSSSALLSAIGNAIVSFCCFRFPSVRDSWSGEDFRVFWSEGSLKRIPALCMLF